MVQASINAGELEIALVEGPWHLSKTHTYITCPHVCATTSNRTTLVGGDTSYDSCTSFTPGNLGHGMFVQHIVAPAR